MNIFNIVTGPVRSGKSTFVDRYAKGMDIIYDNFAKPVIGIKEGTENTYWIVLDPMISTDSQYTESLIGELKHHGMVNHIRVSICKW